MNKARNGKSRKQLAKTLHQGKANKGVQTDPHAFRRESMKDTKGCAVPLGEDSIKEEKGRQFHIHLNQIRVNISRRTQGGRADRKRRRAVQYVLGKVRGRVTGGSSLEDAKRHYIAMRRRGNLDQLVQKSLIRTKIRRGRKKGAKRVKRESSPSL